jgi:hypothetical protein
MITGVHCGLPLGIRIRIAQEFYLGEETRGWQWEFLLEVAQIDIFSQDTSDI